MNDVDRYRLFLRTIGSFIKEDAFRTRKDAEDSSDSDRLFHRGKLQGYYAVISTLQQQAKPLGIPLEELLLDDIEPDRDLT